MSSDGRKPNELFSEILLKIRNCCTEGELDEVNDLLEESHLIGLINDGYYEFLSEELDDRLGVLVEKGLV